LGLPLGFGFLGASYAFAGFAHSYPTFSVDPLTWFQLLFKPFAFAFLAFTYYFSKKPLKKPLIWDITLSALIVALTSMVVLLFVAPSFTFGNSLTFSNYRIVSIYVWTFDIVCLLYITIHTIRSHLEAQDSKTILSPFGYMLLGIGQYSLLIWSVDGATLAFYGDLVLRWAGLVLFLLIAYRAFGGSQKRSSE